MLKSAAKLQYSFDTTKYSFVIHPVLQISNIIQVKTKNLTHEQTNESLPV